MSDEKATKVYKDGSYAEQFPSWHEAESTWKADHLLSLFDDTLLEEFAARDSVSFAEVGCGFCGVMAGVRDGLKAKGITCELTGYDIAEYALKGAAERFPEVKLFIDDFLETTGTYDVSLMIDFFEHVDDAGAYLRAAAERCKWSLFHIPLDINTWGKLRRRGYHFDWLKEDRGHINYYTKRSALELLEESGHRIRKWKFTPWGLEVPDAQGGGRSEKIIRFIRRIGMSTLPSATVRVCGGASLAVLTDRA